MKQGEYETVPIENGEILMIRANGQTERQTFNFKYSTAKNWWEYGSSTYHQSAEPVQLGSYIEDLKYVAAYQGYDPEVIDELLRDGFSPWEVEEYLYA